MENYDDIAVSVFCLAYNHEKYIRKTLEGFVSQRTNFKYEVVVHDDASTDNTREIIREYIRKYPDLIKVIFQKENQYSKGINFIDGVIYPSLKGRYIAVCEGDDYWNDADKLQKQYDALEAHPECSLSTHKVKCCNEDGSYNESVIPEPKYNIRGTGILEGKELFLCYWIRGHYPFQTSSYFYRKDIISANFDDPRDIGILRKALIKGAIYYFDEPMSTRRLMSEGSWSSRLKEKGKQGDFEFTLGDIEEDEKYDRYTEFKYHNYIEAGSLIKLLDFADFKITEVRKQILDKNLSPWCVVGMVPVKRFFKILLKYMLLVNWPDVYLKVKKGKIL